MSEPHPPWMATDEVMACADLVNRAGGVEFELGYLHDDVPMSEAGWYAHAKFRGTRITAEDHPSPSSAALVLAERVLSGAQCKCGRTVALRPGSKRGCQWQLVGPRWEPGCNAESIHMPAGTRGDLAKLQQAMRTRHPRSSRWQGR